MEKDIILFYNLRSDEHVLIGLSISSAFERPLGNKDT